MGKCIPTGRAQHGQEDDGQQHLLQGATARLVLLRLGMAHAIGTARLLARCCRPGIALVRRGLPTSAHVRRCALLHRRMRVSRLRGRARGGRPARREDHHRGAPVLKALAPEQVGRLQVSELDELRQLRIAQRPVLLAVAGEIPWRL